MRNYFILILLLAGAVVSCGRSSEKHADTDSVDYDTIPAEAPDTVADYTLTPSGVGPVAMGEKAGEWPESIEGLYDYVESDTGNGVDQYNFYSDQNVAFTVLDFGEGKVDLVILGDSGLGASPNEDGEKVSLRVGSPFADVLALPGVEAVWEELDEEGMWYWRAGGLWFAPAQDRLPHALADALYDGRHAPDPALFTDDVVIGYIGTGLPF